MKIVNCEITDSKTNLNRDGIDSIDVTLHATLTDVAPGDADWVGNVRPTSVVVALDDAFEVPLSVTEVIFNDPATIVFWSDETKTVVKCQNNDTFDKEKGLALCLAKKAFGNDNTFNKIMAPFLSGE